MTDNKINSSSYLVSRGMEDSPSSKKIDKQDMASAAPNGLAGENTALAFEEVLAKKLQPNQAYGIKLSQHAQKRIAERQLDLDAQEFFKLRQAFDTLKNKGGKDSLVVTPKAAYIVDVDQRSIVTAMDKNDMAENVFTKIDSTLFIN